MKKYIVNFTNSTIGATSPIDNITAADNYTAADYIRDCKDNADLDYITMLDGGVVTLEAID